MSYIIYILLYFLKIFNVATDLPIYNLQCPRVPSNINKDKIDRLLILPGFFVCSDKKNDSTDLYVINNKGQIIETLYSRSSVFFDAGKDSDRWIEIFKIYKRWRIVAHGVDKKDWYDIGKDLQKKFFYSFENKPINIHSLTDQDGFFAWDHSTLLISEFNCDDFDQCYFRQFKAAPQIYSTHGKFHCSIPGNFKNIFSLSNRRFLIEVEDNVSHSHAYVLLGYNKYNLDLEHKILIFGKLLAVSKTAAVWLHSDERNNKLDGKIFVQSLIKPEMIREISPIRKANQIYACFANNETDLFIGNMRRKKEYGAGFSTSMKDFFDISKPITWQRTVWCNENNHTLFEVGANKQITVHPEAISLSNSQSTRCLALDLPIPMITNNADQRLFKAMNNKGLDGKYRIKTLAVYLDKKMALAFYDLKTNEFLHISIGPHYTACGEEQWKSAAEKHFQKHIIDFNQPIVGAQFVDENELIVITNQNNIKQAHLMTINQNKLEKKAQVLIENDYEKSLLTTCTAYTYHIKLHDLFIGKNNDNKYYLFFARQNKIVQNLLKYQDKLNYGPLIVTSSNKNAHNLAANDLHDIDESQNFLEAYKKLSIFDRAWMRLRDTMRKN